MNFAFILFCVIIKTVVQNFPEFLFQWKWLFFLETKERTTHFKLVTKLLKGNLYFFIEANCTRSWLIVGQNQQ